MLETMVSQRQVIIHMLPRINSARFMEEILKLIKSILLKVAIIWQMLFWEDQSELELMLLTGADMPREFSATVETTLTTTFFWLVSQAPPIKSKTLGVHLGEKRALSDLHLVTLVEFAQINLHGSNDRSFIQK